MLARPNGRPPFRADHVGSLLRPPELRQAYKDHQAKRIDGEYFAQILDRCIRDVVALQEAAGFRVITDGEFRRGSYWGRFVERIEGFVIRPAAFKFRDDHGHEVDFTATYAAGRLSRSKPLALDEFVFLRDVAAATPKITLPAPSTMHFYRCTDFADAAAYATAESFFADLIRIYREEIAALADAGCRYIQLDEVALALLCDPAIRAKVEEAGAEPDRLVDLYIETLNAALSGAPPDVIFGIHMCRGNFKGHYLGAGGYEFDRRAFLRPRPRQSFSARIRYGAGRRFPPAAFRQGQGRRARAHQQQDAGAGEHRRPQAPRRGSGPLHRSRPARHQPAMRICFDGRWQPDHRNG